MGRTGASGVGGWLGGTGWTLVVQRRSRTSPSMPRPGSATAVTARERGLRGAVSAWLETSPPAGRSGVGFGVMTLSGRQRTVNRARLGRADPGRLAMGRPSEGDAGPTGWRSTSDDDLLGRTVSSRTT